MEEKKQTAIERAREYGIDVSLLEMNLRRSMTERLDGLIAMAELFEEAVKFRARRYGGGIRDKVSRYPEDPDRE